MEEKDEDLIKKFIRGGFTSDNINWMDVQASAVLAAKELQKEIDRLNHSMPLSYSLDMETLDKMIDDEETENEVLAQADDDLTNTVLTKDLIDDLIAKINTNTKPSPTPPSTDTYRLTKDGAYFIYWLMMNYDFILDKGFKPKESPASNLIHSRLKSGGGWVRHIIRKGMYNEMDRIFLNNIKEWLKDFGWVYRKPDINEHNDLYEYIEKLPS
jgi:cellobiose-specific phosphotransferase system component IIA